MWDGMGGAHGELRPIHNFLPDLESIQTILPGSHWRDCVCDSEVKRYHVAYGGVSDWIRCRVLPVNHGLCLTIPNYVYYILVSELSLCHSTQKNPKQIPCLTL